MLLVSLDSRCCFRCAFHVLVSVLRDSSLPTVLPAVRHGASSPLLAHLFEMNSCTRRIQYIQYVGTVPTVHTVRKVYIVCYSTVYMRVLEVRVGGPGEAPSRASRRAIVYVVVVYYPSTNPDTSNEKPANQTFCELMMHTIRRTVQLEYD
jgi:hypothetical protein